LRTNGAALYVTQPAGEQFYTIDTVTDTLKSTIPLPADSQVFGIAVFNLGAAQGGLTLFMTDALQSQIYTYAKGVLGTILLEPGAAPYGIAVTPKNWQVP
jgi:hypothetical protein